MSAALLTPTTTAPSRSPSRTAAAPTHVLRLTPAHAFASVPHVAATHLRGREGVAYSGDAAGTVHYRFYFPTANSVSVVPPIAKTIDGELDSSRTAVHPAVALTKQVDGAWEGSACYPSGLHGVLLLVDGSAVLSPHLPIGPQHHQDLVNLIDIPPVEKASCCYLLRPGTEHGSVAQDYVTSYTTDEIEEVYVYLPPSYHKASCATRRYPVLYLVHDDGDHTTGFVNHGKVNVIADNLIADGKMTEMIIVMKSNACASNKASLCPNLSQLCDDLTEDIIPYIDNRYRTKADRDNRAIAGLSMGSMQATRLSITRSDLFSYVGIFSGFMRTCWSGIGTEDNHIDILRKDPAAYQAAMNLIFRCMGDEDVHRQRFEEDDAMLAELGVVCERRIYHGPHSWQVWRQAAADFLPGLF